MKLKPRTRISLAVVFVLVVGAAVALADKTTTTLTAPATITMLRFHPPGDGGVMPAQVCGRSRYADGGITPITCYDVPGGLAPGNSINISVKSLADGAAKTFWQGQEGL